MVLSIIHVAVPLFLAETVTFSLSFLPTIWHLEHPLRSLGTFLRTLLSAFGTALYFVLIWGLLLSSA